MRAASRSVRWCSRMRSSAIRFSAPAVNGATAKFQNCAMASCAGVRESEIARTSASAARNSGEPKAGGGGGRSGTREDGGTDGASDRHTGVGILVLFPGPSRRRQVGAQLCLDGRDVERKEGFER